MAQPGAYQDVQSGLEIKPDHNPLLSIIGAFENDSEYDALTEDVYEYRRQLDAGESQNAG